MPVAEKVTVELELKDQQYNARVRANERVFATAMDKTGDAAELAQRRVRAASVGIADSLRSSAAAIAGTVGVAAITRLADTYVQLQNRLKVTGLESAALADQYAELQRVAEGSRSPLEATVQLYARLRLATEGLNLSNQDVTRTTEILAKALKASGASAAETEGALIQFSQALGSGVLQGDELRSIRENAPAVARAIAKEFGVTVGELKKLGEEGKLTTDRVVNAVLKAGTEIDTLFAKTEATVGDALTNLGNKLIDYIGQTDESLGATNRLSQAIGLLADNLDTIVPSLTIVAGLIGARYTGAAIGAAAASITAARAAGTFGAGLTALAGGPISLVLIGITAVISAIVLLNEKYGEVSVATRELEANTATADAALKKYEESAIAAANANDTNRIALQEETKASREAAAATLEKARANYIEAQSVVRQRTEAARVAAVTPGSSFAPGFSAGRADLRQRDAVRIASEAEQQLIRLGLELDRIDATAKDGGFRASPTRSSNGSTASSGRRSSAAAGLSDEAQALDRLRSDLARVQEAQLTDAERAAADLAETIAIIKAAQAEGFITPAQAAILTGGAAGQDLVNPARDPLQPALDISGRDIARDLREGDQAEQEKYRERGAEIASSFLDILRSGNIGEEIGLRFADAAFNNLQQALTGIFAGLLQNGGQAGGIVAGIGSFFGFGGGRAMGGPVRKGFSYDVGESGREKFVAPADGYIMPNMGAQARSAGAQRIDIRQTFSLEGATGDAAIYGNVQRMIVQGQRQTLAIVEAKAPSAQTTRRLLQE